MPNYKVSKNVFLEKGPFGNSVDHYVADKTVQY